MWELDDARAIREKSEPSPLDSDYRVSENNNCILIQTALLQSRVKQDQTELLRKNARNDAQFRKERDRLRTTLYDQIGEFTFTSF